MKKIARFLSFLFVSAISLTSCSLNKAGYSVFMFKLTGNPYGEALYKGYQKVFEEAKLPYFNKTPSEASVAEQIKLIETFIMQGVKSITVSAAGKTGYDNVLKQAHDEGIKVVSVDSPISPKYRVTHIDQCDPNDVGKWLARAAILISLGEEYPYTLIDEEKTTLEQYCIEKCQAYQGEKKNFAFLSSTTDSPSQNEWIKYTSAELKQTSYQNVVKQQDEFMVKYGKDEMTESTIQANALIESGNYDVIIAPTTVGMAAAGEALKTSTSPNAERMKLTGLGMPSEMHGYMPSASDSSSFIRNKPCPYMAIWRVDLFGEIAAAATIAAMNNKFDGTVGSTFEYFDEQGKPKTFTCIESDDGGTKVISLNPYAFHKDNIAKWKDVF